MICNICIIAVSLLVCSFTNPAWAGLSEPATAEDEATGHPLSVPEKGGSQSLIYSFLDRFAGILSSDPSADGTRISQPNIVTPISETTLFTAFTRAGSPMNSYYSRSGTDNEQTIIALSRSQAFVMAAGNERIVLPDARLVADVQGHFVGSGTVLGDTSVAPIQSTSSNPYLIQTSSSASPSIPIPLPFLLTGSGLAVLLALKKRAEIQLLHT